MQVTITHHTEQRGILFRKTEYVVEFTLELTDEERNILVTRKPKISLWMEPNPDRALANAGMMVGVGMGNALKGKPYTRTFNDLTRAKLFEAELLEKICPEVKSILSYNATYDTTPKKYNF